MTAIVFRMLYVLSITIVVFVLVYTPLMGILVPLIEELVPNSPYTTLIPIVVNASLIAIHIFLISPFVWAVTKIFEKEEYEVWTPLTRTWYSKSQRKFIQTKTRRGEK